MTLAGRLHPLLVHFPIAFVLLAAGAELTAIATCRTTWRALARSTIRVGALAAFFAAVAGWLLAGGPDAGTPIALEWHRWLAVAATGGTILAAIVSAAKESTAGRWCYRVLLFASAASIAIAAHIGGALVWGDNFLHL